MHFKKPLRIMQKAYSDLREGTETFLLATGDQTVKVRNERIAAFKANPHIMVLGMTYDVGAEGLDIPQADTVVLVDSPWTPKEVEQAEDRICRPGNLADHILIVKLSTGTPVEQQIQDTLAYKGNVIEAIVGMAENVYVTLPSRGLL